MVDRLMVAQLTEIFIDFYESRMSCSNCQRTVGLLLGGETWILSADCGVAVERGDLDTVNGLWGCCWERRLGYCQRIVGLLLGGETWILSADCGVAVGRGDLDIVSGLWGCC